MTMVEIKDFSTTAAGNTDLFPSDTLLVSSLDNNLRELQAAIRRQANDLEWFEFKDGTPGGTITVTSGTQFRVEGINVTDIYDTGRRVRAVGSATGTIYGSITAKTFSGGNTTLTVDWDSGSLSVEAVAISLSIISAENSSVPGRINHDVRVLGDFRANNLSTPIQNIVVTEDTNRAAFNGGAQIQIKTLSYNKLRSSTTLMIDVSTSFLDRSDDEDPTTVVVEASGSERRFTVTKTGEGAAFNIANGKAVFTGVPSGSQTIRIRFERGLRNQSFVVNPSSNDSPRLAFGRPRSTYVITEF